MRVQLSLLAVHMLIISIADAQMRPIQGQILDETGKPVPFASILIKGSTRGTSADTKGKFSISASTNDLLQISAVNFFATESKVTSSNTISISLNSSTKTESEVIVTAQEI